MKKIVLLSTNLGVCIVSLLMFTSCTYGMEKELINPPLLYAAKQNDCSKISKLLDEGVDVNITDLDGYTALMSAAYNGSKEAVDLLVKKPNIAINHQDNAEWTALMLAAAQNNCSIIKILLNHGADSNMTNVFGRTALMSAISNGHTEAVKCLLSDSNIKINQQIYNLGDTALLLAIAKKNKNIIQLLLDAGADPEFANNRGLTPLNAAINAGGDAEILSLINKAIIQNSKYGMEKESNVASLFKAAEQNDCSMIIKLLNEGGMDVNAVDSQGDTALMYAAIYGNLGAVICLLNNPMNNPNIKVNHQNSFNKTALMYAVSAKNNSCPIIRILLKHGADINIVDHLGATALMHATKKGALEVAQCLLSDSHIKIDQKNITERTAVMIAAEENNCAMIELLLKHGAGINEATRTGDTVLMKAVSKGAFDAVQCLLSNPLIKIDQQTYYGTTALMLAIKSDNLRIINILLEKGANINIADVVGKTALMLAIEEGFLGVIQRLLDDSNIKIDQQNSLGNTALLTAIKSKDKVIIKKLLDAGADPEFVNNKGLTPRNVAINAGCDAEILSLIHKAIIRKHGGVNIFSTSQK